MVDYCKELTALQPCKKQSLQNPDGVSFSDGESRLVFGLKGIVYAGDFHYTSRICANGLVWFHDGMVTGRSCTYEGKLNVFTDSDLSVCNGKTSSLIIYAQK